MSAEKIEVDISYGMCQYLRCRVDIRNMSHGQEIHTSKFRVKDGVWKLRYHKCGSLYGLSLCKCSGVSPNPLQVSVMVESSENGRIENVLSQVRRFTDEFETKKKHNIVWFMHEEEIRRFVPEFRRHGVLELTVVLKLGEKDLVATQAGCSIAEEIELSCVESLLEDFERMMVQDSDRDLEFRCADQSFKAHGAVVCARSPVICSMLGSDMVEGRTRIVNIPDMTPEVFRLFLGYLYTGKLPEVSFEVALSLYESGDQYAVLGLVRRCRKYLLKHLTVQNACDVLVVANAHSDKDFVEKVIAYILETKVPLVSDRWSAFSDDHPKLVNKVLKRVWDVVLK